MEHAANSDHKPVGKNLVICCDGTGNEISEEHLQRPEALSLPAQDGQDAARQMLLCDPGGGAVTATVNSAARR
ncbi:uncharacterized protein (DUF2235 family) [Bradyrhizobium sp. USDA 4354]